MYDCVCVCSCAKPILFSIYLATFILFLFPFQFNAFVLIFYKSARKKWLPLKQHPNTLYIYNVYMLFSHSKLMLGAIADKFKEYKRKSQKMKKLLIWFKQRIHWISAQWWTEYNLNKLHRKFPRSIRIYIYVLFLFRLNSFFHIQYFHLC